MRFVTLRRSEDQTTIVNLDQIAYLTQDMYGTAIHFASGEHIICPEDIDMLAERLFGTPEPERLLIQTSSAAQALRKS